MKLRVAAFLVLLFIASAHVQGAEERPDFSGRWRLSDAPSETKGSGWGPEFTITQREDKLIVERVFFSYSDLQPPLKFCYALNGHETKNKVMMGRGVQESESTVAWDGRKLVITTTYRFQLSRHEPPLTSQVRQILWLKTLRSLPTLAPSLVLETTRDGVLGGSEFTTRTVYTKY